MIAIPPSSATKPALYARLATIWHGIVMATSIAWVVVTMTTERRQAFRKAPRSLLGAWLLI